MTRWSLAGRLAWILSTILAVLWLGASLLSALVIRTEILEVSDAALHMLAGVLLQERHPALGLEGGPPALDRRQIAYQIRDLSGRVIARSEPAPEAPFEVPLAPGFADDPSYRVYTTPNEDGREWVQVGELRSERSEAVRDSMLGLLAPLVVLLGLAALAVHWAIVRMTASVRRAQVEIASRGAGSLEPITELGGPEELAPIADAVNRLLSRLRTMLEAERAFAANSAHQLRTPVAAALAQAQLLASELKGPGSERAKGLALELARLSHTVEKLLQLARAESGLALSRDAVDLNRLAAAVVDQFTRNTRHAGRIALSTARGSVIVEGDLDILGIAIENLVDNAFKHGGDDVRVTVSVSADGAVSVADTGRGVREEELGGLSTRFVRGSTPGAGSGLGLSIVAAIAEQSGGRLRLSSPGPGKGFVATIELRLHTPHTPPRVSAPPRPTGQSRANAPERAE